MAYPHRQLASAALDPGPEPRGQRMETMLVGARLAPAPPAERPAPPDATPGPEELVITAARRGAPPGARLEHLTSLQTTDVPGAMFTVTPADMERTHRVYSRSEYNVDSGEAQHYYADPPPEPDTDARTLTDDLHGPNPRLRMTQGYAHDEVKPSRAEVRATLPQANAGSGPGGVIPLQAEQYSAHLAQQIALRNRDVALNQNGERPDYVRDDQRPAGYVGYVNTVRVEPHLAAQQRGDEATERRPTGTGAGYNPDPGADRARQADRRVDGGHDSTSQPEYRAPQRAEVPGPTPTGRYRDNPGTTHRAETEIRPMMEGLGELPGFGPGPLPPAPTDPGPSRRPLGAIAPSRRGPAATPVQAVATAMAEMMQWAHRGSRRRALPTAAAAGLAQQQLATPAPAMDWQSTPLPVRARRSGMRGAAQAFPMQQVPGAHVGGTAHQGRDSLRPQRRSMLGEFDRHTAPWAQLGSHGPTLTTRRGPVGEGSLGAAPRGLIQTAPPTLAPAALPQTEFRATNRARLAAAFQALRTGESGRQGPLAVGQDPAPERDGPVHRVADSFAAAMGRHARGQRVAPWQHADAVEGIRQDPNRADAAGSDGFKPAAVASVAAPAVLTYTPTVLSGRGEESENVPVVRTTGRGGPGTVGAASITPALTSVFRSDQ